LIAGLILAAVELDRDVVQMAIVGVIAGLVVQFFSDGGVAVLLGLIIGALLGDALRDARGAAIAVSAPGEQNRWWQRRPAEPIWVARITWSVALVALSLMVVLVVFYAAQGLTLHVQSQLLSDLFDELRTARFARTAGRAALDAWYAYVLLLMSAVNASLLWRGRRTQMAADIVLRRIAVCHCLALLLLAGTSVFALSGSLVRIDPAVLGADWYQFQLRVLAELISNVLVPLLLVLLNMLLLGRHLRRYLERYAWMPALGVVGLTAVIWIGFHLCYLALFNSI
jgi:hypothetical protein